MAMASRVFLKNFFNIHRLHDMQNNDYERWVRFEDFVSKDNMTDNMKKWAGYLEKDPTDPSKYLRQPKPDGFFKIQDYPKIDDLTDEDLEKLYLVCQVAFEGLKKNRDAYTDTPKVYNFINNYYNIFSDKNSGRKARPSTENSITNLANLLETITKDYPDKTSDLQIILNSVLDTSLTGFINDLKKQKYNTNDEFQTKLKKLAVAFTDWGDTSTKKSIDTLLSNIVKSEPNPVKKSNLESLISSVTTNRIADDYGAWAESHVSATSITNFKDKYSGIFKELYKEPKILDAFKQYEGEDKPISAAIEKTKTDMDYANPESKDFVSKKREEELTLPQQIRKWASDTYEGYFAKYSKFKGDRVFMNAASGDICKALDKAEIKPTDGLAKIIENEQKIKKSLQDNVKSREAFGWFLEALKELQSDSKMSKAFDGALKSGRQMKSLVKEIIIMAAEADDPKVTAKAKVALEVLSVIKYGNTTSKVMDAIKGDKELFSIMSNKDLSWNKNAGVQFVTNALDKSVRAAFIGAGYGATFLWNNARKLGSKFNQKFGKGDTADKMRKASARWASDHADAKKELEDAKKNAEGAKTVQETKRTSAMAAMSLSDPTKFSDKETELETWLDDKNALEAKIAPTREKLATYDEILSMLDHFEYLEAQKGFITDPKISDELSARQADILNQMYDKYEYVLQDLESKGYDPAANNLRATIITEQSKLNTSTYRDDLLAYNTKNNDIYERQDAIDKYKKATAEIEALDETIKKDQKKIDSFDKDHANVYEELMAYWDFLETGRDSHTGPLYTRRFASADKNQKRLNPQALARFAAFRSGYHAA